MTARTNEDWVTDLARPGPQQVTAIADLRTHLYRAALYALNRSAQGRLGQEGIAQMAEDCAQDALLAVLDHLADFRSESQFTTWAYKFAINITLMAVRHERWRNVSLDGIVSQSELPELPFADPDVHSDPGRAAQQREFWLVLRDIIDHDLTVRQRQVFKAMIFDEAPMDEMASYLGSNRNAIYKLLHDARQKIKASLLARGFDVYESLALFAPEKV